MEDLSLYGIEQKKKEEKKRKRLLVHHYLRDYVLSMRSKSTQQFSGISTHFVAFAKS